MKKVSAVTVLACAAALSGGCVVPGNYSTQVSAGLGIAPDAPECPYGYYDYAPYDCAPYGYYGPDWFVGGAFIGAGPWFRGPSGFYGHVDNRYDPHNGYAGPKPARGERPFAHFMRTKPEMVAATSATRAMMVAVSTIQAPKTGVETVSRFRGITTHAPKSAKWPRSWSLLRGGGRNQRLPASD
jgi:hypothetical protein